MKRCTCCNIVKDTLAFSIHKKNEGNIVFSCWCKECNRIKQKIKTTILNIRLKIYISKDSAENIKKRHRLAVKKWREKHPDILEKTREKRLTQLKKWRKKNPNYAKRWKEKHPDYFKKWVEKNRNKARLWWHKRNSTINASDDGSVTAESLKAMMYRQNNQCNFCKKDITNKYHIDHIIPISKEGLHSLSNIQLLCPFCNWSKGTKILTNQIFYGECNNIA